MRPLTKATVLALVAACGVAATADSATHETTKPVIKKITLGDDYYAPVKLTVKKGTTIKWIWGQLGNSHDVKLKKGPKGAKPFHSPPAAADFTFSRKLTVPGTYNIVCTLHITMTMKIIVKAH
ncbi:MAG: hypothetical protein JWM71_215 [Solirubrobacteraceae bacterium]|nr:hypothetical protein [Solirubrobacteraceae bacterium]